MNAIFTVSSNHAAFPRPLGRGGRWLPRSRRRRRVSLVVVFRWRRRFLGTRLWRLALAGVRHGRRPDGLCVDAALRHLLAAALRLFGTSRDRLAGHPIRAASPAAPAAPAPPRVAPAGLLRVAAGLRLDVAR